MRKMFIATAALIITFAGFSSTQADSRTQQNSGYYSNGYRTSTPTRSYRTWRGGVFDRLMEMERRKNEMLFGGFRR